MEIEKEKELKKDSKKVLFFYDFASILVSAMLVLAVCFIFIFRTVGIVGPSMQKTLYEGDTVLVSAFVRNAKLGDVVIITQPNPFNEPIVKRVIATENQWVDIDFRKGAVYVWDDDGTGENSDRGSTPELVEPYIAEKTLSQYDVNFPTLVPEGHVFVMGDNRNNSSDSRVSDIGFIDEDYLLGKVIVRVFPLGSWKVE